MAVAPRHRYFASCRTRGVLQRKSGVSALAFGLVEGGQRHEGVGLRRIELGDLRNAASAVGVVFLLAVDVAGLRDHGLVGHPSTSQRRLAASCPALIAPTVTQAA
jgi:hypothetical protein